MLMWTVLILLALHFDCNADDITTAYIQQVNVSSWSGDKIREFSMISSMLLECLAAAVKHLLTDQLIVFIPRDQTPQCLIAQQKHRCLRLESGSNQPTCGIRVYVLAPSNCSVTITNNNTIIQHRVDNSTDFYRSWEEYAAGFGQEPQFNYWIGLRLLHNLTRSYPKSLRVYMRDWNNAEYWADYTNFSVANENDQFRLSISGFRLGQGNIGDSLSEHNGMKFSTFDSDNDIDSDNCAQRFHGAWWYWACHVSNPNGLYYTPPAALNTPGYANGINWYNNFGHQYSLKEFKMTLY